jgi:hypothetical protein
MKVKRPILQKGKMVIFISYWTHNMSEGDTFLDQILTAAWE